MSHINSIRAEFLFEFTSKEDWVIHGQSLFAPYNTKVEKIICLDKGGNALTSGRDFVDAQVMKTYPVKAYRLVRVSEAYNALERDIFDK